MDKRVVIYYKVCYNNHVDAHGNGRVHICSFHF